MSQEEFEDGQSRIFEALRNEKGPCPEADVLFRYAEGALAPNETAAVDTHLSLCGLCLDVVGRLMQDDSGVTDRNWKQTEKRLDRREVPWQPRPSRPWRSWSGLRIPAAAAAALLLGVTLWVSTDREPATGPVSTTRGDFVQLQEPIGRIQKLDVFRWNEQPAAASFRFQVQDGGRMIWDIGTPGSIYQPSDQLRELLVAGTRFRWRVQALDSAGRNLGESSWVEFEIAP
jgi:hypothetical protein